MSGGRSPSPSEPPDAALRLRGLRFAFTAGHPVLQDIHLTVEPGERVGFIGPNGAGKTTLFLLASGVLRPSAGEIWRFGLPAADGMGHRHIGMVFQNPDDQLFSPTVWDDVAFGPQNLGLSPAEVETRVDQALALTGIAHLAGRAPHHLSGGEKRMVSIAGVLAMHPRLIIYDEPSANLDTRSRRRLISFLEPSQETLLIASHDLEFILEVCGRVVLMDEGRIVADGPPRRLMSDTTLMEAHGLERPHSLTHHIDPHHDHGRPASLS
jgi:cobalt/nickel transport system ATP-binding protein